MSTGIQQVGNYSTKTARVHVLEVLALPHTRRSGGLQLRRQSFYFFAQAKVTAATEWLICTLSSIPNTQWNVLRAVFPRRQASSTVRTTDGGQRQVHAATAGKMVLQLSSPPPSKQTTQHQQHLDLRNFRR